MASVVLLLVAARLGCFGAREAPPLGAGAVASQRVWAARMIRSPTTLRRVGRTACTVSGGDSRDAIYPSLPTGYPKIDPSEVVMIDSDLKGFIEKDVFDFDIPRLEDYVQPATIDIPVSGPVHLVKEKVLPFQRSLAEIIPKLSIESRSFDDNPDGILLLKGQTYLIHCGKISLPPGCRGVLSPKSSIGRIDTMVRAISDGCGLYDVIPASSDRHTAVDLWVEVSPSSFNIRIHKGQALTQLMVLAPAAATGDSGDSTRVESPSPGPPLAYGEDREPVDLRLHNGMVVLGISIPDASGALVGYEAVSTNDVVDLAKIGAHPAEDFFRPIRNGEGASRGRLVLEKDRFYILCIRERVSIPQTLSGEMIPFSHNIGELRAHYAGFFDPGFGFGEAGELCGSNGVLEVRPHETVTIYDGQPICLMQFFHNRAAPLSCYGSKSLGSHYQGQTGPVLAKYFRSSSS